MIMRIDCNHLALTMLFGKNAVAAAAAVDISCYYILFALISSGGWVGHTLTD